MESEPIVETLYVDHPDDHDQKRKVTLWQRGNEVHLSKEAAREIAAALRGEL